MIIKHFLSESVKVKERWIIIFRSSQITKDIKIHELYII